ncbi:MAG: GFA family protein [Marinibacterium sp.]|nr:GFA family protein [Marinibacterium sp.]
MKQYKGSCHCGAVTFAFPCPEITRIMRCDCSLCARKGIAMTVTTIPPDQIEIFDPEGALATYQFATMTARHHFCSRCGIHTFVETRLNPGHYRINLGCVDEINAMRLPEELYDGKSL